MVFLQEFAKEYQVLSVEKQQNTTEEGKIKNFIVLKPSLIVIKSIIIIIITIMIIIIIH